MERRTLLGAGGLAGLAAVAARGIALGAQSSEAERDNVRIVTDFCASWSTRDLRRILPFLAADSVYRMSETVPPVTGPEGVEERLGSWIESSQQIEFRILETFAKGPIVVNHRIDRFVSTTRPLTWEGVGVFFVQDGWIKEWQDFTIRVEQSA
jgi:limonene-1,2-epoxide hydrolase